MAIRTNPLVSAAVVASAAAIAVATPALAPSAQLPSPHALEAAKVQLTTFADVLALTPLQYSDTFFNGWGYAVSLKALPSFDWAVSYVPTRCNYNCTVNGVSGVGYMIADALINGNGKPDPILWNVSAVNYFFEVGTGPGALYLLDKPFGDPNSPMYNPAVAGFIAQAFNGLGNGLVTATAYVTVLNAIATLAANVPGVGPYIYGGIQAILGYPGYPPGASGLLEYVTNVIAGGGVNPIPVPKAASGSSAASTLVADSVPAPAVALSTAAAVDTPNEATTPIDTKNSTPAVAEVKDSTPAVAEVKDSTPAVADVKDSTPAATEVKDSTPAVAEVKDSTPTASDVITSAPVAEAPSVSVPAPEVKFVEAPDAKPSTPAAVSAPEVPSTHDLKNLEKEAAEAESSSAGTASEPKSGASDSKAGGSDAKAGASEATSGASEAAKGAADAKAGGSDAGSSTGAGDSAT